MEKGFLISDLIWSSESSDEGFFNLIMYVSSS